MSSLDYGQQNEIGCTPVGWVGAAGPYLCAVATFAASEPAMTRRTFWVRRAEDKFRSSAEYLRTSSDVFGIALCEFSVSTAEYP